MQNLVFLIEPRKSNWDPPSKGGNLILNRFCIEEDAAFELCGVNSFKAYLPVVQRRWYHFRRKSNSKEKGKEYVNEKSM